MHNFKGIRGDRSQRLLIVIDFLLVTFLSFPAADTKNGIECFFNIKQIAV